MLRPQRLGGQPQLSLREYVAKKWRFPRPPRPLRFADKTFELVDQFGAGVGGYQSVQAAVDQASGGETILSAPRQRLF